LIFWATVCKTIRPKLSDRCPVVCPVYDIGVLWPNGWMDLADETLHTGICLGHIVLDGDPAPHGRGHSTPTSQIYGAGFACVRLICCPCLLWPNGWMDQNETWHRGRPRPWPHCIRWGPSSPSRKGAQPPIFGPCLLWPNGRLSQLLLSTCFPFQALSKFTNT